MSEHDPSTCHVCGRHAIGVGIGRHPDNRWLCQECSLLIERIKDIRRFDPYELAARAGGMDAAGPLIDEFGPHLDEYTEEQALRLVGAIWKGCADEMRRLIKEGEAPF